MDSLEVPVCTSFMVEVLRVAHESSWVLERRSLLELLATQVGVKEAVVALVRSPHLSPDHADLVRMGRLDLLPEALAIDGRFVYAVPHTTRKQAFDRLLGSMCPLPLRAEC